MKRTETDKPPYLSFCMIARNAEATIEEALKSIRARAPQAEIVVVDTMSSDRTPEIAQRYADVWVQWAGPKGTWEPTMPWFDDAAAARQKSFELASGKWRGWIDADDRLPGPEEVEKILKLNNRWAPSSHGDKVKEGTGAPRTLEDVLREIDEECPRHCDVVYAPYLYRHDESYQALEWQDRERFVRWDPKRWAWSEKAHEILVPITGPPPPRIYLDHLLFVHEKRFDDTTMAYASARHYDVLLKQYEAGEITARRCLYLASYAPLFAAERELEFIEKAHEVAGHALDRYRALMRKGAYFAARDLFLDAMECYGASTTLSPEIPDAWFAGMFLCTHFKDFSRAIEWGERGMSCEAGKIESSVNPRHHVLHLPAKLAHAYKDLALLQIKAGLHDAAEAHLRRGVEIMAGVNTNLALGADAIEANNLYCALKNLYHSQEMARAAERLAAYLFANDEPLKAVKLREAMPWNLEDHPITIALERRIAPVVKHVTDHDAYKAFYRNASETGAIWSPDAWLDPVYTPSPMEPVCESLARARWAAAWINEHSPNAVVLDVGCFDGIIGIPLLKLCPGIRYVGADMYGDALNKFSERLNALGLGGRAELHLIEDLGQLPRVVSAAGHGAPDVAIWFEVIEHVPDPGQELRRLADLVTPNGRVMITTPWGAFDAGHPPANTVHGTPRDPRGHVRAMTLRDLADLTDAKDLILEEGLYVPGKTGASDSMYAIVAPSKQQKEAAAFAVPGALWDWHGRMVDQDGMGASEKIIVYLARALAADHRVDVFGPVPEADTYQRVRYWPREQIRYLASTDQKIVVSRSPTYARTIDEWVGKPTQKILWLQDAWYPDLTPEAADQYERIVVVSEWHKRAMQERHCIPLDKMVVLWNFILPELYAPSDAVTRKRDHFIYASSPDRGVIRLLDLWPKILRKLPEATLDIFYGFRGAARLSTGDPNWTQKYEATRKDFEALRHQKGVKFHGMIPPARMAREFMRAGVWLYPTKFEETYGTVATEARAAGCVPVCPKLAGLAESADITAHQPFWIPDVDNDDDVVASAVLASQLDDGSRTRMAEEAIEKHQIGAFLTKWKELLRQ